MKKSITIAIASALVTAAAIKAAPALAQGAPASVSLVRTTDLDLGSDSGRRALDQRLANAAREVCGSASAADVEGRNEIRKCRDEALAKVRADRGALIADAKRGEIVTVARR